MVCRGVPQQPTPLAECAAALSEAKDLDVKFPMYVVPLETVLKMKEVRPHQELLCDGLLSTYDPAGPGNAMFVSHQWATEDHPDPDGKQLKIFQKAMKNLLTGQTVARPNVWAEMVCNLAGGSAQSFTGSKLNKSPVLVWYDYFCVPQYDPDQTPLRSSRSLCENPFADQRNAIASIPAYIERCEFFVALCPLMKHPRGQSTLSMASWERRGWCRAEAVVRDLSAKKGLTLIVESPQQVSLAASYSMLKAPGDGVFTISRDRKVVGELLRGALHQKLHSALRSRDFPAYRFLLNHQSALLRNSDTTPCWGLLDGPVKVPDGPEEIVADFLMQNGFERISDRDKSGWSPLLYAALGGKPEVVEALLMQGSDPNDHIRKVQDLVMFVKGTPAISICAVQQHNEAMRVLLRYGADPNKQDPGGSSPLFYVSNSDNVEGAKILLQAGADLSLTSIFSTNAFDQACAMGAFRILKEVLNEPPHAVSRQEALGMAMTTGHGNPETVAALLSMGCDKDGAVRNRNALSKFFASAMELKHRVAPNSLTTLCYHAPDATPLMRSILTGSYACAYLLIESKARIDLRNNKHQTAFDLAVKKHAPDSLLWQLWKHGAGDYASKDSIAWWSANAPERFPVADELSDLSSTSSFSSEEEEDPMISMYF